MCQLICLEIVELDEAHPGAARPYGEIQTVGLRGIEQGRDLAVDVRCTDAGDVNGVEPIRISVCGRGPPSDCSDRRSDWGRRGLPSLLVQVR